MRWLVPTLWMLFLVFFDCLALSVIVSNDFGVFPLAWMFGLPIYALVTVVHVIFIACLPQRGSIRGMGLITAGSLLLLAPAVMIYYREPLTDQFETAQYSAWLQAHAAAIRQQDGQPAVLTHWDAWGIAGMENDSYLVFDPTDQLLAPTHAAEWRNRVGVSCDFAKVRRLRQRIFLVVTYECPIDDAQVRFAR